MFLHCAKCEIPMTCERKGSCIDKSSIPEFDTCMACNFGPECDARGMCQIEADARLQAFEANRSIEKKTLRALTDIEFENLLNRLRELFHGKSV